VFDAAQATEWFATFKANERALVEACQEQFHLRDAIQHQKVQADDQAIVRHMTAMASQLIEHVKTTV
jgi:hypothetical protein